MALGKKVDTEGYAKLVQVFKDLKGPIYGKASSLSGYSIETVKRAWSLGWPERGFPAIKDDTTCIVSSSEGGHSPTLRVDPPHEPGNAARQLTPTSAVVVAPSTSVRKGAATWSDALETLADGRPAVLLDEQKIIAGARNAIRGFVASVTNILAMYQPTIAGMQERLTKSLTDDSRGGPKAMLKDMDKLTRMMPRVVATADQLMKMERLLMGMPQEIKEVRTTSPEDEAARATRLAALFGNGRVSAGAGKVIDVQARAYEGEESADDPA